SPATFDTLQPSSDDELVIDLAQAGRATASESDPTAALIALADQGHPQSIDWVLDKTANLKPEQASKIYSHFIDNAAKPNANGDVVAIAVKSVAKLFELDPTLVLERLKSAPDDSMLQQAMLLGLF